MKCRVQYGHCWCCLKKRKWIKSADGQMMNRVANLMFGSDCLLVGRLTRDYCCVSAVGSCAAFSCANN
ncbi:hypothetical protein BATDEDRAFT_29401 [Batrachochytrium dendrobatidis JAM81]|uniref:Uncharacterized protein n=1 Tax=Batrachochytrium dendrobatidis (strain JAM81 / FGSC 10211) TaxID=684364 RepID=F4NUS6_BATDJ|nr:uncharacterized protein BATDEDRAFT_29401 [Batrachochytrium dendrobatidis JAM81]EGF83632.1 hypothetical protein BATDEDRAFT_29401 [Batrachochytrium dendrobatidis JAM81]|eukprot:XP_006675642.1 hypothetical protein BATDEDRAFT_29401 [Batrachochytrium dendrobatidis JAM81]